MRCRKGILVFLSMLLLVGTSACGEVDKQQKGSSDDTSSVPEVTEGASEDYTDEVISEPITTEAPTSGTDFEYKMAEVYNNPKGEGKYDHQTMSFVVELTSPDFSLNDFVIKDTKTGINLCDSNDYVTRMFIGAVCTDGGEHMFDDDNFDLYKDNKMYTILITNKTDSALNFRDLSIEATCFDSNNGIDYGTVPLEFNSVVEQITTTQEVLHDNTLVNVGGDYYIYKSDDWGSGLGSGFQYNILSFENLQGSDDVIPFDGTIGFVDDETGEDWQIPDGYSLYFDSNSSEVHIGLSANSGDVSDDVADDLGDTAVRYRENSSYTYMIFI